ncbi:MAG TPA: efflux RND transporter periplasmic adaptor subunit [Terriglobales bacterium]|nr:efflux RND transporter periplasmic adaptor subunit [Terriglobales bacterium]
MKRTIHAFAITVVLSTTSLFFACGGKQQQNNARPAFPAAPVTVALAEQAPVPIEVNAIGNAQAYRTVQVKSMVDGQIERVLFKQGDDVRAGQLMFQLDKRPFQAALDQAEGKLAQDEATAANARAQAARSDALLKAGVLAPQDAQAQEAQAAAYTAAVKADKAAVETAHVNLGYTDIRAPISGRAGAILVNLGNLVKANDTNPLTTLNQVTPIYVAFNIPEAQLPAVRAREQVGLQVQAFVPNDPQPEVGTLSFIDNAVDQTTGTIKLMGTFRNQSRKLWPGQFFNVRLVLGIDPHAVVVPASAVQNGENGKYIYVVKSDGTAVMQPVTSSRTYRQLAVVDKGIQAGERVIVDGQYRVIPNSKVQVVRTVPVTPKQVADNAPAAGDPQ